MNEQQYNVQNYTYIHERTMFSGEQQGYVQENAS